MKEFLREYFCSPETFDQKQNALTNTEESKGNTSDSAKRATEDGDLRMIPGGRYGCTQFLKIVGPDEIRQCSVGKTTQMV